MKPSLLFKTLAATIPAKLPILLKGQPGIGKTAIVEQATEEAGFDLILSHPVVDDPTDYKGMPFVIENKDGEKYATFLPFGNLREAIEATGPTVYFLDDLGQAPPAVQSACMQLLHARKINGHDISKNITFLAATNRKRDKANVKGVLEPVKSRFASIFEVEHDVEDWIKWAVKPENNIPAELIAFIRFRPDMLNQFEPTANIVNTPCPRTVENVGRLMNAGIPHEAEHEAFKGAAGEAFATEFVNFLKIYRHLPNPAMVLADPDNADIPTDKLDVLYALCTAISRMASEKNHERFFRFAERLPVEFGICMVKDAVNRTPELHLTKSCNKWVAEHPNIYF